MNNVTSIIPRFSSLCSKHPPWQQQPAQLLRRALHTYSSTSCGSHHPAAQTWRTFPKTTSRCSTQFQQTPRRRTTSHKPFSTTTALSLLKPYDPNEEAGLSFRSQALTDSQLSRIYKTDRTSTIPAEDLNRLLQVLHARRVDGTLDIPFDTSLSGLLESQPELEDLALKWLRRTYPVDEDAAILARFKREEATREQEHPSALMARGQRLGLIKTYDDTVNIDEDSSQHSETTTATSTKPDSEYYGPQSGAYYAKLSEKEGDVFGQSELDKRRAHNKLEAEEEDRAMQDRIDKSMEAAAAKARAREVALAERPEHGVETAGAMAGVRPPNEFEKWVIRSRERAESGLTLESPEVVNMSSARRIVPMFVFVLLSCVGLAYFAEYWIAPRRSDRLWPNLSLSVATCTGILGVNVLVFALWKFPGAWRLLNRYFVVSPAYPWVASAACNLFSHTSLRHLGINMFSLFVFGPSLHEDVGRGWFMAIYLASGLIGSVVSLSSFVFRGVLYTTSNGASGCIWGVSAAYLWLHRDDSFQFWVIPEQWRGDVVAKGWGLLVALVVMDTVAGLRRAGIDLAAHLTGVVVGISASEWWKREHGEVESGRGYFIGNMIGDAKRKLQGTASETEEGH